jgi:subtilisin family serine protease
VFFQAVEQEVHWKDREELEAAGIPVPGNWPPPSVSLWGLPTELGRLFEQAYEAGARVHTNSWGAPVAGDYNMNARAVDDFMWRHPDMLILFSAGNSGLDEDGAGVIDLDSVGSPGTAKNCLTVGASENDRPRDSDPKPGNDANWSQLSKWPTMTAAGHVSDDVDGMAAFSSRGPVDGDRIKPDVVAPGTNVLSMLSSRVSATSDPLWGRLPKNHALRQFYCWSGGTSMSTPLVAGAAALVRQHLVEQRRHVVDGRQPSGALVKAFLVNGAVSMRGQFPGEIGSGTNNVTGFGRVDLTATIASGMLFADEPTDAVASGETREYQVDGVVASAAW